MELKTVKISELKIHPKNPRMHPESAINKLEKSIKEFGWTNPVLLSKDGYVLAGHARLKAAKQMGIKEVPALFLDLEGAKADAYLIADNKLQNETTWNIPMLKDLLQELDTGEIDMAITGFDAEEIEDLMTKNQIINIDDLLNELDTSEIIIKPIWATIRTSEENKEALEKTLCVLENYGIKVERSYATE
jgi:ParB-like chromosome segregation protein Spo0J